MLFGTILTLFAGAMINFVQEFRAMKSFLDQVHAIEGTQDISLFKDLVEGAMIRALIQIGLLVSAILLILFGLATHRLTHNQQAISYLGFVLIATLGVLGKNIENKVKSLPVSDETLRQEYASICKTWMKKALPDW